MVKHDLRGTATVSQQELTLLNTACKVVLRYAADMGKDAKSAIEDSELKLINDLVGAIQQALKRHSPYTVPPELRKVRFLGQVL